MLQWSTLLWLFCKLLATMGLPLVQPGLSVLLVDIAPWQRTALIVNSVGEQQQRES